MEIWLNPACSKCRTAVSELDAAGIHYTVRRVVAEGTTVLVAEQSAARALAATGRAVLMRLGAIVHDGPVDALPEHALREAFLGG